MTNGRINRQSALADFFIVASLSSAAMLLLFHWAFDRTATTVILLSVVTTAAVAPISVKGLRHGRLLSTAILMSNLGMMNFGVFVLIYLDKFMPEAMFEYNVPTTDQLESVIILLAASLVVVAGVDRLRSRPVHEPSLVRSLFKSAIRPTKAARQRFLYLLIVSFLLGCIVLVTNATVFEYPYPYQYASFILPFIIVMFPTYLWAAATFYVYVSASDGIAPYSRGAFRLFYLVYSTLIVALQLPVIGSRGLYVAVFAFVAVQEFLHFRRTFLGLAIALIAALICYFLYDVWPGFRSVAYQIDGLSGVITAIGSAGDHGQLPFAEDASMRLSEYPMLGQSLLHLVYSVQLVDEGKSLFGQSFLNLIPQALPSFLDGVFLSRPESDEVRLREHFIHGGGFFLAANVYWNGGVLVVMIFYFLLKLIVDVFDSNYAKLQGRGLYSTIYFVSSLIFLLQNFYGLQGAARILELLGVVLMIAWYRGHLKCPSIGLG